MKDGVLLVDKDGGMTSFDVVAKIRKLYNTAQVGHTGTLDPMATGLLVVLVGRAVKAAEYLSEQGKSYDATLILGITTDTEDISGKVLTESDDLPAEEKVKAVCSSFQGRIMQIPPMYSALKRNGKKLCDLARKGIEIEREARAVNVYSLSCESTDEKGKYRLQICCSKGTYIRTLCADIGKSLGCGGTMTSLRRTGAGGFSLADALKLEDIEKMSEEEREGALLPTESLFSELQIVKLPPFYSHLARSGCEIYQKKIATAFEPGQRVRLYDEKGFFSLGETREFPDGTAIKPIKKFRLD